MLNNEMSLPNVEQSTVFDHRLFGTIGMMCAPMLFVASLFYANGSGAPNPNQIFASAGGVIYLSGILCSAIGMRRLRVTGKGTGSAILFAVQIIGLFLAMMFDVLEFTAPELKETTIFFITDMAYPFSHILMIVVGIAVLKAGIWRGWRLLPAFISGGALPSFFAASAIFGRENAGFIFPLLVTIGFFLLGYAVRTSEKSNA